MILIDNAVEQILKTYLHLPTRISGISVPRKRRDEASYSFPSLLDLVEEYGGDKLDGIDLGMIEWYHRQRNQLYHEGFGLTVSIETVEIYSELAQNLFANIFGAKLGLPQSGENLLGEMLTLWSRVERGMRKLAVKLGLIDSPADLTRPQAILYEAARISDDETDELVELRELRNQIVHGEADYKTRLTDEVIARLKYYAEFFENWADGLA